MTELAEEEEEAAPSEWSRLPVPLQHEFYDHAAKATEFVRKSLLEQAEKLSRLRVLLKFKPIEDVSGWKDLRIAAIDGSSPMPSERLGARFGVYCAGYMVFQGEKLVEENYQGGRLISRQAGRSQVFKKGLDLMRTKLERELAMKCIEEKDVDYVLIDGSFFGFQSGCSQLKNYQFGLEGYDRLEELVVEVRDKTLELARTRKAIEIVKRPPTLAFDGYLLYQSWDDESACINATDREILTFLMPERTWFAYEWFFGNKTDYQYYSVLRGWIHMHRAYHEEAKTREEALSSAKSLLKKRIKANLAFEDVSEVKPVLQVSRYYMRRVTSAPPFCFGVYEGTDIEPILEYMFAFHNPGTGFPFPLDLIHSNVVLTLRFRAEFVREVEARLVRDPELEKMPLRDIFRRAGIQ